MLERLKSMIPGAVIAMLFWALFWTLLVVEVE
jgi:hypothetical protein